jgi:hypothetical protein
MIRYLYILILFFTRDKEKTFIYEGLKKSWDQYLAFHRVAYTKRGPSHRCTQRGEVGLEKEKGEFSLIGRALILQIKWGCSNQPSPISNNIKIQILCFYVDSQFYFPPVHPYGVYGGDRGENLTLTFFLCYQGIKL